MKMRILAASSRNVNISKHDILAYSGKMAGICYMKEGIDDLLKEDITLSIKRANNCLISGHHSVYGHYNVTLILENIPKILAMMLNNIKAYNTSEKSARYTRISGSEQETELYNKWISTFSELAKDAYPQIKNRMLKTIAQENARYLLGIFNPTTNMAFTTNLRDFNYFINCARNYITNVHDTKFSILVKKVLEEFIHIIPSELVFNDLNAEMKLMKFSLFDNRSHIEEFGENFSTNYYASFAQLAQAQRHRTLNYSMLLPEDASARLDSANIGCDSYYIPELIRNTKYQYLWIKDISSLRNLYPQGKLVYVNERGTVENFILKCTERLCGHAQLEIMKQTNETLHKYLEAVKDNPDIYTILEPYSHGPRCTFPGWKCNSPCMFGSKFGIDRVI